MTLFLSYLGVVGYFTVRNKILVIPEFSRFVQIFLFPSSWITILKGILTKRNPRCLIRNVKILHLRTNFDWYNTTKSLVNFPDSIFLINFIQEHHIILYSQLLLLLWQSALAWFWSRNLAAVTGFSWLVTAFFTSGFSCITIRLESIAIISRLLSEWKNRRAVTRTETWKGYFLFISRT